MNNGYQTGSQIAIYIPSGTLKLIEVTRKKLGMNRSRFILYCIINTLTELSVLSKEVLEECIKQDSLMEADSNEDTRNI